MPPDPVITVTPTIGSGFPAALRLPEPQRYQLADGSLNEVRPESYEYSDFAELPPGTVEWIAAARTDLPRLLTAVEALRRIAAGWLADAPEVPVIDRDLAGRVIQQILTRELLGKEAGRG